MLSRFARDVREGLQKSPQRAVPPFYFYDAVGTALFEAITHLPEYGLTRADERLIERYAHQMAAGTPSHVIELGSGTARKTRPILEAAGVAGPIEYHPIDVSEEALRQCAWSLADLDGVEVFPREASYFEGLRAIAGARSNGGRALVLFLGSTIGNFDRVGAREFLRGVRGYLREGDAMLVGADLVKPAGQLLAAYDDPTGVTAAFNRNLLARMNRELGADFDLRRFRHEARYRAVEQRVEMHLVSTGAQTVAIPGAELDAVAFAEGESIWTESSHKFTVDGLSSLAESAGYRFGEHWVDAEWPFAEALLEVV
ncbi:MAG: L-histidine N(alpha)-methyltransferase [Bryobacteraceae bacterium]